MMKDASVILNLVQTIVLLVMIPFTVYYVKNHSPYVEDKRYIETRLAGHDVRMDRLTLILDRVTEKQ